MYLELPGSEAGPHQAPDVKAPTNDTLEQENQREQMSTKIDTQVLILSSLQISQQGFHSPSTRSIALSLGWHIKKTSHLHGPLVGKYPFTGLKATERH